MRDRGGSFSLTFMPETLHSIFLIYAFLQISYIWINTTVSPHSWFPITPLCMGCEDPGPSQLFPDHSTLPERE